jgi:hypothetical protein
MLEQEVEGPCLKCLHVVEEASKWNEESKMPLTKRVGTILVVGGGCTSELFGWLSP